MDILDACQTAARLPYPKLADAISRVAVSGEVQAPPRLAVQLPGGVLLVMPASDKDIAITKLVTVHQENAKRGLPAIQGEVIVLEAETGARLGLLEGATVTARRTAALSLLAARELAPSPEGPLLIIGAGTQGHSHLEAFHEGLGVSQVYVASRTPQSAEKLAEAARSLGVEASAVEKPEDVLGEVSLIITATTSRKPVLPDELPEGVFVAAVGAFSPGMAEIPPGLLSRSTVVVDTLDGTKEEAGDLIQAHEAEAFEWKDATPLADALQWSETPDGTVVFKSVGHAFWDLAAARTAFDVD